MPYEPPAPTAWLWEEIERRYGAAEAASLREGFNAYMKGYQRAERLKEYRKDIARMQERIAVAEARGNEEALIRSLQRKIAHRRQRLEHGWPDESAGGGEGTLRLKLFWGDFHGGIEHIWEGNYNPALGEAIGHAGDDPDEKIAIQFDGDEVRVTGGSFDGEQIGRVWRRTAERIEVEFSAG